MAQFIRTQFDMDFTQINQVCQISYHDQRVIEIFYDTHTNRTVVDNNGLYFWLTSPDIENITIKDVLIAIGIHNEQIVLRMPENHSLINILDTDVKDAPLCQIGIYSNNQTIPVYIPNMVLPRSI